MTASRQGFLRRLRESPRVYRPGMNPWPPFRGAGIRVTRVSADDREVDETLGLRVLDRNDVGTPFGGSRYAMADPFRASMMVHALRREDVVRDEAGASHDPKPGSGLVHARFRLDPAAIDAARVATAGGGQREPSFPVDIAAAAGEMAAVIDRTLRMQRHEPADGSGGRSA